MRSPTLLEQINEIACLLQIKAAPRSIHKQFIVSNGVVLRKTENSRMDEIHFPNHQLICAGY